MSETDQNVYVEGLRAVGLACAMLRYYLVSVHIYQAENIFYYHFSD